MRIQVSKNELGAALGKAAVGQGFDQGTGQWLTAVAVQAIQNHHPALTWSLEALRAEPEAPQMEHRPQGWVCLNHAVLIAGPILTDFHMAGQPLDGPGFDTLDVPELWTHLLEGNFSNTSGALAIDFDEWLLLQRLAAKTYVPATEESRQRGAG